MADVFPAPAAAGIVPGGAKAARLAISNGRAGPRRDARDYVGRLDLRAHV